MDTIMMGNNPSNLLVPSFARGLNILLVDHETTSLMYLALMLEQYSYNVSTTELATVALSMINEEEGRFKLVIANVNMPDMACLQFLRVLVKKGIPVILMASERSLSAAKKALVEGASLFLEKPITFDDLKYIWQHVYRVKKDPLAIKLRKRDRETWENENMTRGITIREANNLQFSTNCQHINVDPKEKNKQVQEVGFSNAEISTGTNRSLINNQGEKRKAKKVIRQDSGHTNNDNVKFIEEIEKELTGDNVAESKKKTVTNHTSSCEKLTRRFVWTPELHLKFTAALRVLENRKARPKQILKLMNVPNLTPRQVASHLQKHKLALAKYNVEKGATAGSSSGNRQQRNHGGSKISVQPGEKTIKLPGSLRGHRSSSIAIGFGGQSSSCAMPNSGKNPNHELNAVPISLPPAAGSVLQTQPSTEYLAKLLDEEGEEFTGSVGGVNPSDIDRYYKSLSEALLGNNQLMKHFNPAGGAS